MNDDFINYSLSLYTKLNNDDRNNIAIFGITALTESPVASIVSSQSADFGRSTARSA